MSKTIRALVVLAVSFIFAGKSLYYAILHLVALISPDHAMAFAERFQPFTPEIGLYSLPFYAVLNLLALGWILALSRSARGRRREAQQRGSQRRGRSHSIRIFAFGLITYFTLMRLGSKVLYPLAGRLESEHLQTAVNYLPTPVQWGPPEPPWVDQLVSGLAGAYEELVLVGIVATLCWFFGAPWRVGFLISVILRVAIHLYYGPIHAIFRVTLWAIFGYAFFSKHRSLPSLFALWVAHFTANAFGSSYPWRQTALYDFARFWETRGEIFVVLIGLWVLGLALLHPTLRGARNKNAKPTFSTATSRRQLVVLSTPLLVTIGISLVRQWSGASNALLTIRDTATGWLMIALIAGLTVVTLRLMRQVPRNYKSLAHDHTFPTSNLTRTFPSILFVGIVSVTIVLANGAFHSYKITIPAPLKAETELLFQTPDVFLNTLGLSLVTGYLEILLIAVPAGLMYVSRLSLHHAVFLSWFLRLFVYIDAGLAHSLFLIPLLTAAAMSSNHRTGSLMPAWCGVILTSLTFGHPSTAAAHHAPWLNWWATKGLTIVILLTILGIFFMYTTAQSALRARSLDQASQ